MLLFIYCGDRDRDKHIISIMPSRLVVVDVCFVVILFLFLVLVSCSCPNPNPNSKVIVIEYDSLTVLMNVDVVTSIFQC